MSEPTPPPAPSDAEARSTMAGTTMPGTTTAHGQRLADVGRRWAGDHGEADQFVRRAIAGVVDTETYLDAVALLCGARLLLPIVATGDEGGGPDPDRHAEMAAVSLRGGDGRSALLAFTGIDALQAWDRTARPVPGTLDDVAATVGEAGSDVLLLDVAGPVPFEIGPDLLTPLASGQRLVRLDDGGFGWMQVVRPDGAPGRAPG